MKHSVSWIVVLASGLLLTSGVTAKPPGGGNIDVSYYWISVDPHPGSDPVSPIYDPPGDCLGWNPGPVFWVDMPREECSTVVTSEGHLVYDHIRLIVKTDANRDIVSVQLRGGDSAGRLHMSDEIAVDPQTPNMTGDFTLHVDADEVTVWGCNGSLKSKKFVCADPVGTISLGDFHYVFDHIE